MSYVAQHDIDGIHAALAAGRPAEASAAMATALGWSAQQIRPREVTVGGTTLSIAQGRIGHQPAAVFASVVHRNGVDPLDGAAFYAYHTTAKWGLLADDSGVSIFNSHWVTGNQWFRLPSLPWSDAAARGAELLAALSPEAITTEAIDRLASDQGQIERLLRPVDDELMERLDSWRSEALKYAVNHEGIDERLQMLIAQLFVLRTVEDRALGPNIPSLRSVLVTKETFDKTALSAIYELARHHVGVELFSDDPIPRLPAHVVAGVISDLYAPHGLPGENLQYNFAWIDSDVLGLAYEKYLSTVILPTPPAPQMDMFRPAERGSETVSVRRRSGVYFTPTFISRYLAQRSVDAFYATGDAATAPRVIDFSCGSGSFLVAAVDRILECLKAHDPTQKWGRRLH